MRTTCSLLLGALLARSVYSRQHPASHEQIRPAVDRDARTSMATKRVAIIGAGAAGSSTAYHLRQYAATAGHPLNITIFERNAYIGGRTTTVNAFDDPDEPIELGASIFVDVNTILVNATQKFKLEIDQTGDRIPDGYTGPALGVWNGAEFVFRQNASSNLWDAVKLFWRYGLAPLMAQRAMKDSIGRFLGMYEEETGFPWADLTDQVQRVGLLEQTGVTGEQLLRNKGVGDLFSREVIQAATRVNYAQNIGVISGMETMVCLAPQGAMSVVGGNWRIMDAMARSATNDIRLETKALTISQTSSGSYDIAFSAKGKPSQDGISILKRETEQFDEVVIAGPYQFSDLKLPASIESAPESIPYVTLYVTLFTSPLLLSPAYFGLPPDDQVPLVTLTTLTPEDHEEDSSKPTHAGRAGFFSVSMLRPVKNPKTQQQEYLYKVFSPNPPTPEFFAGILGVDKPKSMDEFPEHHISWKHLKTWQSYPVEWPRVTFDKLKLGDGLWYTGAMESFISTMETNALMGMNVAKLMVNEWTKAAKSSPLPVISTGDPVMPGQKQQILNLKAKL